MKGHVARPCVTYGSYIMTVQSQVNPTGAGPLLRSLHCSGSLRLYLLSSLDCKPLESRDHELFISVTESLAGNCTEQALHASC